MPTDSQAPGGERTRQSREGSERHVVADGGVSRPFRRRPPHPGAPAGRVQGPGEAGTRGRRLLHGSREHAEHHVQVPASEGRVVVSTIHILHAEHHVQVPAPEGRVVVSTIHILHAEHHVQVPAPEGRVVVSTIHILHAEHHVQVPAPEGRVVVSTIHILMVL